MPKFFEFKTKDYHVWCSNDYHIREDTYKGSCQIKYKEGDSIKEFRKSFDRQVTEDDVHQMLSDLGFTLPEFTEPSLEF
jgi:hypothetical protein